MVVRWRWARQEPAGGARPENANVRSRDRPIGSSRCWTEWRADDRHRRRCRATPPDRRHADRPAPAEPRVAPSLPAPPTVFRPGRPAFTRCAGIGGRSLLPVLDDGPSFPSGPTENPSCNARSPRPARSLGTRPGRSAQRSRPADASRRAFDILHDLSAPLSPRPSSIAQHIGRSSPTRNPNRKPSVARRNPG